MDCASLFYLNANIPVVSNLLKNFSKMSFIYPPINAKFATLVLIGLVAIGTKSQEKERLKYCYRNCIADCMGLVMIFSSLIVQNEAGNNKLTKIFPK